MKTIYENVKKIVFALCVLSYCSDIYCQENNFSIDLELVFIEISDFHPKCETAGESDSIPVLINFEFFVNNQISKQYLFGTNTRYYYLDMERYYYKEGNDGIIGRFLLINGNDTIPLYTYIDYLVPNSPKCKTVIWGSINFVEDLKKHPIFAPFLCRFSGSERGIKILYDYLDKCELIYVPVVSDYERKLRILKDEAKIELDYPKSPIKVNKRKPFEIHIFKNEDNDDYVIYPLR